MFGSFWGRGLMHGLTGGFSRSMAGGAGYAAGRALGVGARGFAGSSAARIMGSPLAMTTAGGALAGGVYGAFSDRTSVLGGMMGGAALGGVGYGAARYRAAALHGKTAMGNWRAGGIAATALARRDAISVAKGTLVAANRGLGRITSTLKNWG